MLQYEVTDSVYMSQDTELNIRVDFLGEIWAKT